MTEITQKHYEVFETQKLAEQRMKAEEASRNSMKSEILGAISNLDNKIELVKKDIDIIRKDVELSSLKTRNWLLYSSSGIIGSILLLVGKHYLGW